MRRGTSAAKSDATLIRDRYKEFSRSRVCSASLHAALRPGKAILRSSEKT
jgi:hypothetical protein